MAWLLIDLTHAQATAVLALLDGLHKALLPNNLLSVNQKRDGTRALVKVATDPATIVARLPAAQRTAVLRVFDENTHHEALALVQAADWPPLLGAEDGA